MPVFPWTDKALLFDESSAPRQGRLAAATDFASAALSRVGEVWLPARRRVLGGYSPRCDVDARGTGTGIAYFDTFV